MVVRAIIIVLVYCEIAALGEFVGFGFIDCMGCLPSPGSHLEYQRHLYVTMNCTTLQYASARPGLDFII